MLDQDLKTYQTYMLRVYQNQSDLTRWLVLAAPVANPSRHLLPAMERHPASDYTQTTISSKNPSSSLSMGTTSVKDKSIAT